MNTRQRDHAKIRDDALRIGASKLAAGCDQCAAEYFSLARRHGATDSEVSEATAQALEQGGALTRRAFLSTAAAGTASVVALLSSGGSLRELLPAPASVLASGLGQVAWLAGLDSSRGRQLVGVGTDGSAVGSIQLGDSLPLLSSDGTGIYLVGSEVSGEMSITAVSIYDPASGKLRDTVRGAPLRIGYDRGIDMATPSASGDGSLLSLVHIIREVVAPAIRSTTKSGVGGVSQEIFVDTVSVSARAEIIDLLTGRTTGPVLLEIGSSPPNGGRAYLSPPGTQLVTFLSHSSGESSLTVASFDRAHMTLTPGQRTTGVPAIAAPAGLEHTIRKVESELVASTGPGMLHFLSLASGATRKALTLELTQVGTKGQPLTMLSSPDGSLIYHINVAAGEVHLIDAEAAGVRTLTRVHTDTDLALQTGSLYRYIQQPATLSPDSHTLYMIDWIDGGIVVLDAQSLRQSDHWLSKQYLRAIWAPSSGDIVFALGIDGDVLYGVSPTGVLAYAVSVPDSDGFLLASA